MPYIIQRFGATYAGGVDLPTRAMEQPVGLGRVASGMIELPGGGSWDSTGTAVARLRSQIITIRGGWLAADAAAMTTKIDALRALVGTRSYLWSSSDGGTTNRWRYARVMDVRATAKPGFTRWTPYEIDFELAAGNWSGAAHAESTALATGNDTITMTNGGNVRVSDVIITVTAVTSNITALSFYKANLFHWHYTGTIVAGTSLVVNCGTRRVINDGTGDFANFILQSDHADNDWLPILAGVNTFLVERTGGAVTSTVRIAYSDGWA